MKLYQEQHNCGVCGLTILADILIVETSGQQLMALTHMECMDKATGRVMEKGEVEENTLEYFKAGSLHVTK